MNRELRELQSIALDVWELLDAKYLVKCHICGAKFRKENLRKHVMSDQHTAAEYAEDKRRLQLKEQMREFIELEEKTEQQSLMEAGSPKCDLCQTYFPEGEIETHEKSKKHMDEITDIVSYKRALRCEEDERRLKWYDDNCSMRQYR